MGAEQQYVVFRLMGQLFGAAIDVVREVNYLTPVTRLPNTPEFVEGVIDLRGEVLPVIDLRKRLHLPPREADAEARLMVLNLGERAAALIVDGVDQVLTLNTDQIVPPDARVVVAGRDYVTGVARTGETLVVILDLARLMND
ncbi:MAG TPA: chemotaxis protein CheW [Symbiobacteriaceae bacterium]|nr:chemotaxis protein CheW [Symbiobacteriaceae bacterium]